MVRIFYTKLPSNIYAFRIFSHNFFLDSSNKRPTADMLGTAIIVAKEAKVEQVEKKATYWDLLTLPNLRIKNMCSCICWMLLGAIYYGCSQYVGQTSSNVFLTMCLTGVLRVKYIAIFEIYYNYLLITSRQYTCFGDIRYWQLPDRN